MRKKIFILITLFISIVFSPYLGYAHSPYKSYEVLQVQNEAIIVRDVDGDFFIIKDEDPDGIKVGDHIRYDSRRHRLRKSPWQFAEIIGFNGNLIVVELNGGEKYQVNMKSKYRDEFKLGDQVLYKKSSGQIIENKFKNLDEK